MTWDFSVVPVEKPKRTPRVDRCGVWVLTVDELLKSHNGGDQIRIKV